MAKRVLKSVKRSLSGKQNKLAISPNGSSAAAGSEESEDESPVNASMSVEDILAEVVEAETTEDKVIKHSVSFSNLRASEYDNYQDKTHEELLSIAEGLRLELKEAKKQISREKKAVRQKNRNVMKVVKELQRQSNDVKASKRTISLLIFVLVVVLAVGYNNTLSKNVNPCLPTISIFKNTTTDEPSSGERTKRERKRKQNTGEAEEKKTKESSLIEDLFKW